MEGGRNLESCFDLLTEQGFGRERQLFVNLLDTVYAYWGSMTMEPHKKEKPIGKSGIAPHHEGQQWWLALAGVSEPDSQRSHCH